MPAIRGKQRRYLRGRGQKLSVTVHVGRGGLSDAVARQVDAELARHELVKVRLPAEATDRKALAAALAEAAGAECVGVTGHTALLYRANEDLPRAQRIELP